MAENNIFVSLMVDTGILIRKMEQNLASHRKQRKSPSMPVDKLVKGGVYVAFLTATAAFLDENFRRAHRSSQGRRWR